MLRSKPYSRICKTCIHKTIIFLSEGTKQRNKKETKKERGKCLKNVAGMKERTDTQEGRE